MNASGYKHLFVSYYHSGSWTMPRDYAQKHLLLHRTSLRYDKLHQAILTVRSMGRYPVKQSDVNSSRAFRELNDYVTSELIKQPTDSVSLVYVRKQYQPGSNTFLTDTVFAHTYNPREIHAGKKMD